MKKLIYKGIIFDDFQLYNGDTGDYGDYNSESLNKFNSANVYVCPHCIKKYNLYAECGVFKEEIEKEIAETEYNGITFGNHHQDLTCSVKRCYNKNSYDCMINTEDCQLVNNEGVKTLIIISEDDVEYGRILNTYVFDNYVNLQEIKEKIDEEQRENNLHYSETIENFFKEHLINSEEEILEW